MTNPLIDLTDHKSTNPFLVLLPKLGSVAELEKFSASLFAKLEKAKTLQTAMSADGEQEAVQRLNAEYEMLKNVLNWIKERTL